MNGKLRPISCLAGWSRRGANRAIRRRNSGALKHFSERASCFERAPNAIFGQIMGRYCTQSYLADTDSAPRELVSCQIACYLVNRRNPSLALRDVSREITYKVRSTRHSEPHAPIWHLTRCAPRARHACNPPTRAHVPIVRVASLPARRVLLTHARRHSHTSHGPARQRSS